MLNKPRHVFFLFLLFLSLAGFSQTTAPKKEGQEAPKTAWAQRRLAKKQWWEQRINDWEEKKKISTHDKRLQTKKTLRRMKQDRKKAERSNSNSKQNFLQRWFPGIF